MRPPAAARGNAKRRGARPDAGALALEVGAVGERDVAVAVAPCECAAGAGVAERFHVFTHGHGVGLVVHEAIAHAYPPLRHDAVVLPDELRRALDRGWAQKTHTIDGPVTREHRA